MWKARCKSSFLVGVVRCHRLGMVGCSQHYSCGRVIDTGSCTYKMMKQFCVIRTTDAVSKHDTNHTVMPYILLTLINFTPPLCISNGINYTCGMKLFIKSQTSIVQLLKFGNGYVLSTPLYRVCNDLSMQRLKLIHVSKSSPGDQKRTVTDIMHMIHFVKNIKQTKERYELNDMRKIRKTSGT